MSWSTSIGCWIQPNIKSRQVHFLKFTNFPNISWHYLALIQLWVQSQGCPHWALSRIGYISKSSQVILFWKPASWSLKLHSIWAPVFQKPFFKCSFLCPRLCLLSQWATVKAQQSFEECRGSVCFFHLSLSIFRLTIRRRTPWSLGKTSSYVIITY